MLTYAHGGAGFVMRVLTDNNNRRTLTYANVFAGFVIRVLTDNNNRASADVNTGTPFACFTSTKVQIVTQRVQ